MTQSMHAELMPFLSSSSLSSDKVDQPDKVDKVDKSDKSSKSSKSNKSTPSASNLKNDQTVTLSNMHVFTLFDERWCVDNKYQPIKPLGKGRFGAVCAAEDRSVSPPRLVAIKKITGAFSKQIGDARRFVREVKITRHLSKPPAGHPNVIQLLDIIEPQQGQFDDLYLVFEAMQVDVARGVKRHAHELTDNHYSYITYQLLCGLFYIQTAGLLHRDLKPENLLLSASHTTVKIGDFGLACGNASTAATADYVQSRYYRAPEVLGGCTKITDSNDHKGDKDSKDNNNNGQMDVWSIGCILAEMLMGGQPLFVGKNAVDQLCVIVELCGPVEEADLPFVAAKDQIEVLRKLSNNAQSSKEQPPKWQVRMVETMAQLNIKSIRPKQAPNPRALDLLKRIFVYHPKKRIRVADALLHPYVSRWYQYGVSQTPCCNGRYDATWEDSVSSADDLRHLIWEECLLYRPHARPRYNRWIQSLTIPNNALSSASTTYAPRSSTSLSVSPPAPAASTMSRRGDKDNDPANSDDENGCCSSLIACCCCCSC